MVKLDELVRHFSPDDEVEAASRNQLLQFLRDSRDPYSRDNLVGHVVADAWIVDQSRTHLLLLRHLQTGYFVSPGGHCDGSADVRAQAIREVQEETGINQLVPLLAGEIYDLSVSWVPPKRTAHSFEPVHLHFHVCFAFEADQNNPLASSSESSDLRWYTPEEVGSLNYLPEHRSRLEKFVSGRLN